MNSKRNRYTFGIGTIGRDMVSSLVSMYLIFYLTDVIDLPTGMLWWITGIILAARVFDAFNDPVMGLIVDNTHTRFGKFKPWIAIGALLSGTLTILLFTDFHLTGTSFILLFALLYLTWGISFTANDISYWSMMPALSVNQKEREKIGSVARIFANIGLFFVVAGIVPISNAIGERFGSLQKGYFYFAIIVVAIMWIGQCITLFGVKQDKIISQDNQHTSLRELLKIIIKNDQLFYTALCMALFMVGYVTTTSFGLYYFKYVYADEGMYSIFAVVLGVSQIAALLIFPLFSKRFERKTLYTGAIILVTAGYVIFFFAPTNTMLFIGMAGILIFIGQAFIQLLMLVFLADTVDYGHLKLGRRNESVTFSLQPFINKMGGAIASGIVGAVVILSGIKVADSAADVTTEGVLMVKTAMMILPLICILISYVVYRKKYIIDKEAYEKIIRELKDRGEILPAADEEN